jgi:flagellar hook-length control protein FliK
MDLSSSATQRSTSSEGLSIQPGSVRSPVADAANEFARHLAENNRPEPRQRRDERPADRAERHDHRAEHYHSSREDETETRGAPRKENETEEPRARKAEDLDHPAVAEQRMPADTKEAGTAEETSGTEPSTEEAAETKTTAEKNTTEDETASATSEGNPSEIATGTSLALPTQGADGTAVSQSTTAATAETSGKPETLASVANTATSSHESASAEAVLPKTPKATAAATAPDAKAKGEKSGTPLSGVQSQATGGDETTDAVPEELKLAEKAKPAKGLGQEAAEQLANRKADGKQTTEQPKATPQVHAAAAQTQRATTMPQSGSPIATPSTDAGAGARGGELPPSLATQTSANGGTATVRIGTLPGQSQPTQVPAATIALQMARNLQKGVSRFDIRLDPPEMGRVDVRMEVRKDGHVVAHLSVERPETLDLLQRDARALQQALNNAGLQADGDSLNFSLKDQSEGTEERGFADRNGGDSDAPETGDETPISPVYNINLSANGGIDIRI